MTIKNYIVFENLTHNPELPTDKAIPNGFVGVNSITFNDQRLATACAKLKQSATKLNVKSFGIIFDPWFSHRAVLKLFDGASDQRKYKATSAGFLTKKEDGRYSAYGKAILIRLESDSEDSDLFNGYVFDIGSEAA